MPFLSKYCSVYFSKYAITFAEDDTHLDAADVAPIAVGKGRGLMEGGTDLTDVAESVWLLLQ